MRRRPTLLDDIIAVAEYCHDFRELRDLEEHPDDIKELHIYKRAERILKAMTRREEQPKC